MADLLAELKPQGVDLLAEIKQPVTTGQAFGAGVTRGVEQVTGGIGQRAFEGLTAFNKSQLQDLAEGINTGRIEPTPENLERFDQLSVTIRQAEERLGTAEKIEVGKRAEFAPIQKQAPIAAIGGQVLGQILPTLAVPGAAAATLPGRAAVGVVTGGALGAAQPTVGEESATEKAAIGAAFGGLVPPALEKVLFPIFKGATAPVVNFFSDVFKRKPQALTEAGKKAAQEFEEFQTVPGAIQKAPGLTPDQVAREAAFAEAGITPAARSRITRNPDDFQREIQLTRQRDSESATRLRDAFFQESKELQDSVRRISDSLGISETSGQSVKTSLDTIQTSLNASKRAAYKDLAETISATDPKLINSIPVGSNQIVDAIEDAQRRFLDKGPTEKFDELMAEFGLLGEAQKRVGRFTKVDVDGDIIKVRGDVKPLNLGNMEDFRKRVNQALDVVDTKQSAALKSITSVIDRESDNIVKGISESDIPKEIIEKTLKARGLARQEKLVFSQSDLVDRLTSTRPGKVTPLVEASRAMGAIRGAPVEQVNKLLRVLRNTNEGVQAIGNMGSSMVVDLVNAATKAGSKQLSGPGGSQLIDFSGVAFTKAINSIGKNKTESRKILRKIVGDDAFKAIIKLEKIGQIRITPDVAVQKGSAPDLINQIIRSSSLLRRIPILGEKIAELGQDVVAAREIRAVSNIKPEQLTEEAKDFIMLNAPRLAAIIGLTTTGDNK